METDETFLPDEHAAVNGADIPFHTFNFDEIDARIHPDAAPHSEHEYRAAGRAFLGFFDQCLSFMLAYETNNPRLAVWVVAIASGRGHITGGISQQELADRLGIKKAAVNKAVKTFQASFGNDIAGIEPMPGQRSQVSCHKFAAVRNQQLNQNPK